MRAVPKFLCDDGIFRFPDGREECCLTTKSGRDEYAQRTRHMWEWQNKLCGLQISEQCKAKKGRLALADTQFDHEVSRGMGGAKRDDRIMVDGVRKNRAVCAWCNSLKGSRRMPYNDEIATGI